MRKNKNLIIFVIFSVFLLAGFIFLQAPVPSGDKMVANALVQQLEDEIAELWERVVQLKEEIKQKEINSNDAKPPVLNNLEPEHMTSSSGIITWGTDEFSDSTVIYADTYIQKNVPNVKKMTVVNSDLTKHHEVFLTGLRPNTMYYYYVSSTDVKGNNSLSNTHTIITLPLE